MRCCLENKGRANHRDNAVGRWISRATRRGICKGFCLPRPVSPRRAGTVGGQEKRCRAGSRGCAGAAGRAPRRGLSAFLQKGLAKNLVNAPRPAPDRGEGGGRFYAAFLRKLPAVLAPHGAHAGTVSAAGTGGAADTAGGDRRCAGRAVARGGVQRAADSGVGGDRHMAEPGGSMDTAGA